MCCPELVSGYFSIVSGACPELVSGMGVSSIKMRLGIFSRLFIGYIIVSVLVIAVSFYAISRLHQFSRDIRYILEAENRILEYEKRLTDSLLSQMRYEKKFIILKDDTQYEQF